MRNASSHTEAASSLMPDVFCRRGVNSIFGNVGCVIAHAFEGTGNENQIQIAAQLLRVLHHPIDQFPGCSSDSIHPVLRRGRPPRAPSSTSSRTNASDAVLEHRHRMLVHRPDQFDFGQGRMPIQLARAPRNCRRLIGHALQFEESFIAEIDAAQIGRNRLKTQAEYRLRPCRSVSPAGRSLRRRRLHLRKYCRCARTSLSSPAPGCARSAQPSSARCCAATPALHQMFPECVLGLIIVYLSYCCC